ncbi:arylsulfatase [Eudoraea chungangensis]|uniref:arylsulfatase n=1 Tax=Eudoraea chungangensis TaxID=1481905 RepID=UPI0023ECB4E4|nr:arylsulfatase [Eudoraea chungangensis]
MLIKPSLSLLFICLYFQFGFAQEMHQPNVILIITDDQGYGDLGTHGNPHIKTPTLDALARESIRLANFYVSPVCAPTRSSLMTGRYSLRTGVRDTYNGGAIMASSEVTIAEMLKNINYTTGIFGKWHLGDNYPFRPSDQGFDESLIHLSGGMGQVGDFTTYFKGDRSYFDPVLWHNNEQQKYQGYCSDIFTDNAISFIEKNKDQPFFCYLSFNAPHTPLQVPEKYYDMYKDIDPSKGLDNRPGRPVDMTEKDKEDARRVYAMVSNIDDNIEKLLKKLEDLKLVENTVFIFMTDNGPQQRRYVGGMRGGKGSVYQGGVRVPFYLRYPAKLRGGKEIITANAHIDVLPTLATLCGATVPTDRKIDGRSFQSLLENEDSELAERELFFYWSRKFPELNYNMAVQKGNYKLVGMTNSNAPIDHFEMFDLKKDPYEENNLLSKNNALARHLKTSLTKTYEELITSKNILDPPLISVGSPFENPVVLNRNDAGGDRGIWDQEEVFGKWAVSIEKGSYIARFKFIKAVDGGGKMILQTGSRIYQQKVSDQETDMIVMEKLDLENMEADLIPFYSVNNKRIFPFWVSLERIH